MNRSEILKTAKPILFNTEMVKAVLDGRKTVTRRVIKNNPCECMSKQVNGISKICDDKGGFYLPEEYVKVRSPIQVVDILYVRETWARVSDWIDVDPEVGIPDGYIYKSDWNETESPKWHPSIHMPKEAARIFLRVTNVSVERLQDINDDGIVAEGLEIGAYFDDLWNSTVKKSDLEKYGWEVNPWVWVIEFERLEVTE